MDEKIRHHRGGFEMKSKIKIRKWGIFTEFGASAVPYILDATKLDVSDDELCYCISEQVYGDLK